ncbi:cytochrome P450 [Marasmius fiardii PR-910]|nr:cytochrome P450 [Marasmius fiardii PR-910]
MCTVCSYWITWTVRKNRKNRPPGPRGLPFIGNALQTPSDHQWLKWHEWQKQYGDVMRITVLGQPSVILSSLEAANDLLESRGNIYSDRPAAIMAGELVGWDRGLGYTRSAHDPHFREFRRLFHQFIGPRACASRELQDVQERENLRLLGKLLDSPEDFAEHIRNSTSSTILLLSYGYPSHNEDPLQLVKIAEDAMRGFAQASEPGKWWVDSFSTLKHIPSWFPGASFKRVAGAMRAELDRLYDVPYNYVKEEMHKNNVQRSFVSTFIEDKRGELTAEEEDLVKAAAASLYSGMSSPSAINSFILAMALYPPIQAKAQAEIDRYLAQSQSILPTLADREALPYVTAMMLEVWRWNPSVPLGLPHLVTQDDEYRGYFIEKGTVIWANIWSILHDERTFGPDTLEFKPERYLDANGRLKMGKGEASEAVGVAFGFGRRLCPGLYLAENSVWLFIAAALTIFRIEPVKGDVVHAEYDGFISHPRPFSCNIKPRVKNVESFLRKSLEVLE